MRTARAYKVFVCEGGFTTVAVAVALLVCLSLVFCLASAEWSLSRMADVQPVADAASLAGCNAVASYCDAAQTVDACMWSLGLTGTAVMGAGLILAAVPGSQADSVSALAEGRGILEARHRFGVSSAKGLQHLEETLGTLCVTRSSVCVSSNGALGADDLVGAAVPLPMSSRSDLSALEGEVDTGDLDAAAEQLQEATKEADAARREANDALERAWRADCVNGPSCLRARAASLAGLPESQNPGADSPQAWSFALPILRSRVYYAQRIAQERSLGQDIESVTDSLAREAYYAYALREVNAAWCREEADGTVSLCIPHLACNSSEVRSTYLYEDAMWPCSMEEEGRTLHSTLACPGARGAASGVDSVASVEAGAVRRCDVCRMDVGDLGAVAAISTSATNGYEHYWQIIVEAAATYEAAHNRYVAAEKAARDAAERGVEAYEDLITQVAQAHPTICPPGSYGCVGVVTRHEGAVVPAELTRAFLSEEPLPASVAVAAATLAPDEEGQDSATMASLVRNLPTEAREPVAGASRSAREVWESLLMSYGSSGCCVADVGNALFDSVEGVYGQTVSARVRESVKLAFGSVMPVSAFKRKAVLVNTRQVLGAAGANVTGTLQTLFDDVSHAGGQASLCEALGMGGPTWGEGRLVLGDLCVPGTQETVPLVVDLSVLGGAA